MNRYEATVFLFPIALLTLLASAQTTSTAASGGPVSGSVLTRRYKEGEMLAYHMSATNQGHTRTIQYEADAKGVVTKDVAGHFAEAFEWSGLKFNGQAVPLPAGKASVQQNLSLDPAAPPTLPDFSRVNPMLIGPCADLMTFYADLWLAIRSGGMNKEGDHLYVKSGTPNSWADGQNTLLGQDSIDFDITLSELNAKAGTAKVIVRHLPPAHPEIKIPAKWMDDPVANTPNNWVEVNKSGDKDHPYFAEIGKETFDVEIVVSLADGKILSAAMDNPVEVKGRACVDAELTNCGVPERYQIHRKIEVRPAE